MSKVQEYFKIALQSLTRRKLRSWLTMIGIFIGIAAVISLISLGQGMEDAILQEFENIGSDKLFIQPKSFFGSIGENVGVDPLTVDDLDFLEGQAGVQGATMYVLTSAKVEYQDTIRYFTIIGVPSEPSRQNLAYDIMGVDIQEGRQLTPNDRTSMNVGFYHSERNLYGPNKNLEMNSRVLINDKKFNVVGIIEPLGSPEDDKMMYIPEETFRDITGIEERVDMILIDVDESADPVAVAEQLERELARHRGLKEGDEDFSIQTPDQLLESFETILNIVRGVLIGIALISLFVGGVGIMNTMYTSVLERNKDIGIMKAIGAGNNDIFMLFFFESGLLGFVGGLLGVGIGIGLAKLVEVISAVSLGKTFLVAHFSIGLVLGALAFSFVVGALAGTLPALQAAKLQPVETLRDE